MNAPELIIIGGKPYSGKSTLAKEFIKANPSKNIKHLSMGDRLRDIAAGKIDSTFAAALQKTEDELKAHTPVPKEIPVGVFKEFVAQEACDLLLLDGFPRYPDRLNDFRAAVKELNTPVLAVCNIVISDAEVFERAKHRANRYEDVKEDHAFVQHRIDDYTQKMLPTLKNLANDIPYYEIDGQLPIEEKVAQLQQIYRSHSDSSAA